MLTVAVDWSGRLVAAERHIWTAIADGGSLIALEPGRDRTRLGDHLVELALADPDLVVGLDFAFSLPVWFLDQIGLENGMSVTEQLAERWLRDCPLPFWGRHGRRRGPEPQYRLTDRLAAHNAKPVFQLGGSGAVGTSSLRGFPLLRRLRAEGFAVWPFDDPRLPIAFEIYPRLLTGPVIKSRLAARERYQLQRCLPLEAAVSEDAFDAAVSAMVMERSSAELRSLPSEADQVIRREGRIWQPAAYSRNG